jgi:hypothetical protein
LRLTVRQYILEVHGNEEAGYRGLGPQYPAPSVYEDRT